MILEEGIGIDINVINCDAESSHNICVARHVADNYFKDSCKCIYMILNEFNIYIKIIS